MMTPSAVNGYLKSEPFRPFRVEMASGKTYEVRHPEMVKLTKSYLVLFTSVDETGIANDEWISLSLMLAESIVHLDAADRSRRS